MNRLRLFYKKVNYKINFYKNKLFDLIYLMPFLKKPFPKEPFGSKPRASKELYMELFNKYIKVRNKEVEQLEDDLGYKVNEKWFNKLVLKTQVCIKNSDLNFNHGRILYSLLSKYIDENKEIKDLFILETGTAKGFSSICMAKALIDMNSNGNILTIDCLPHYEKMYWNSITDSDGKFTREELLSDWQTELSKIIFFQGWTISALESIGVKRINFAFLDAQHTKNSVLSEFKNISSKQDKGDLVFFDDVTPNLFNGVCEAVDIVEKKYPYKIERMNFDENRSYALATKL